MEEVEKEKKVVVVFLPMQALWFPPVTRSQLET